MSVIVAPSRVPGRCTSCRRWFVVADAVLPPTYDAKARRIVPGRAACSGAACLAALRAEAVERAMRGIATEFRSNADACRFFGSIGVDLLVAVDVTRASETPEGRRLPWPRPRPVFEFAEVETICIADVPGGDA